jgi:hypothetical protein
MKRTCSGLYDRLAGFFLHLRFHASFFWGGAARRFSSLWLAAFRRIDSMEKKFKTENRHFAYPEVT